jgi:hypothetical protein
MPPGTEVIKVYQDGADLKVDIKLPGMADPVACTVKKNHAGEFYVE